MSLRSMSKALLATLAGTLLSCGFATNALAGDTTELIDVNTLEVDPAFGISSMNKNHKPSVFTELGIVYGVLDGLNVSASVSYETEYGLAGGSAGFGIGFLTTPVDTDMFDLDVMVDFGFSPAGGYSITPQLELNLDLDPDMSTFGFYLRLGLPIYGDFIDDPAELEEDANDTVKTDLAFDFTLGMYYTVAEGHQLLLEGGATISNLAENVGDLETEGFVSIGYNVLITDTFELTTELAVYLPKDPDGDNVTAALTVGGVFGLLGKE